jgi:hypothetical protein
MNTVFLFNRLIIILKKKQKQQKTLKDGTCKGKAYRGIIVVLGGPIFVEFMGHPSITTTVIP